MKTLTLFSARLRGRLLWSVASVLAAGSVFLTGCSFLPQPTTDPTRFYLLSTSDATTAQPNAEAPVVHLRPIELASYLRVRPLIVRRGNNEVEFREYARWGEPLEQGIARVLREELLARGAASAVQAGGLRGSDITAELSVRVLAFEGETDGDVNFRAIWELTSSGANAKQMAHGDFRASGLKWDGKDEALLAAEFSKAVTALADEIAGALPKAK